MDEWQAIQQIKHVARNAVWPGGGTEPIFGGVVISTRINDHLLENYRLPILVLRPMSGTVDPTKGEEPELVGQNVGARILVANEHDSDMESAIIGANRNSVTNPSSDGRGLLEIQQRLIAEIGTLTGIDGIKIINTARSRLDVMEETPVGSVSFRDLMFNVMVGNDRSYAPPTRMTAVAVGPDANLGWRLPPSSWDFVKVRIVRKLGSPPTSELDGTNIHETSTGNAFLDVGPGSGTWYYGAFAAYDEDSETPTNPTAWSVGDSDNVLIP